MHNLKVTLIASDCGEFITGNTFDEFGIVQNGELLATVRYSYENDDNRMTAQVHTLTDTHIDGMHSEMHLLACVGKTIMTALTEDMSFYSQAFEDENGDNGVQLDLLDVI